MRRARGVVWHEGACDVAGEHPQCQAEQARAARRGPAACRGRDDDESGQRMGVGERITGLMYEGRLVDGRRAGAAPSTARRTLAAPSLKSRPGASLALFRVRAGWRGPHALGSATHCKARDGSRRDFA